MLFYSVPFQMRISVQSIFPLLIVGAFVAALSCTSATTDAPSAPSPVQAPAPARPVPAQKTLPRISVRNLEKRIHDRVNKERIKRGLPTMRWDDALGQIASKHSKDMAEKRYFGHTSPQGHGYAHRYMKSGYACGVTTNGVLRKGAENIYRLSPAAGEDPAEATIRGWLQNAEDRMNLLSLPWDREGIGISVGPDGVLYVTMNFC